MCGAADLSSLPPLLQGWSVVEEVPPCVSAAFLSPAPAEDCMELLRLRQSVLCRIPANTRPSLNNTVSAAKLPQTQNTLNIMSVLSIDFDNRPIILIEESEFWNDETLFLEWI